MQRAWLSLFGVLGIVISCLGFATNRSEAGILGPGLWPGSPFHTDRRAAIKMFFNGKIHPSDVDNILRDTETKKSAKEDEKCSSCSDDPLRVRRSNDILRMENRPKVDNRNASKLKESSVVSSTPSESKSSDVTSKPKTSDATSESKTSDVIPKSETVDATSGLTNSDMPTESKTSHVTTESKTSHVTTELKSSDITLESKNSDVTSEKSASSEDLPNVVLVLIDHNGPDQEATWTNFGAASEFSIQGYLQNCRRSEPSDYSKFPLGESLVFGRSDDCECDRFLRANVGSLLSWAHHVKHMTTGAVSATNFTIPSPLGYERLPSQVKDLEVEVNRPKEDAPRTHRDLRTNWRLVELQRQSSLSSSTPTVEVESATKIDGVNGFDGIWDVFDMFARIRMAFFRILLESLGNLTGSEDEFPGRRPFLVQPNIVEIVSDTVRKLKSLPNENGFMMVVSAPGNEISAVVDVLQREVSPDNTLLVVAGMCSANNEPVPFFANGPGGKSLREALTVWDLPGSIRDAISNGCHGHICKTKLPEEPIVLPSLELLSFSNDLPHKRIVRSKEEEETTTSPTGDDKTTKDSEDVENNSDEKTAVPEMEKRSENGAEISRVDNLAAILGIATSITAMLALNS